MYLDKKLLLLKTGKILSLQTFKMQSYYPFLCLNYKF